MLGSEAKLEGLESSCTPLCMLHSLCTPTPNEKGTAVHNLTKLSKTPFLQFANTDWAAADIISIPPVPVVLLLLWKNVNILVYSSSL